MKLPHHLAESPLFQFDAVDDLVSSIGPSCSNDEVAEVRRLVGLGLPPIVSRDVIAALFGINPGLVWSMIRNPHKYYRHFVIKKGIGDRHIFAPKVALKIIQKWLSLQFSLVYVPLPHVFGFIKGRSHLQAARVHCGAHWVLSLDVRDFFPSITSAHLSLSLRELGYSPASTDLIVALCCLYGRLAQGAPTSPVLSNIVFQKVDRELVRIGESYGARLSRYADDIVFSGLGDFPQDLRHDVEAIFTELPWKLAPEKTELAVVPNRLKVHGLLVHGDTVRLTKGYRNRIRAYSHLASKERVRLDDLQRVRGHLKYALQVEQFSQPEPVLALDQ